jgi:hypothetical protein
MVVLCDATCSPSSFGRLVSTKTGALSRRSGGERPLRARPLALAASLAVFVRRASGIQLSERPTSKLTLQSPQRRRLTCAKPFSGQNFGQMVLKVAPGAAAARGMNAARTALFANLGRQLVSEAHFGALCMVSGQ